MRKESENSEKKKSTRTWGKLKVDTIKQVEMKEKKNLMNKKTSQNQTLQQESHQRNKHMVCLLCKKLRTILEMD